MSRIALGAAGASPAGTAPRTFSLGIVAHDTVWMSGCTGGRVDPESGRTVVEGDVVEQARIALGKPLAGLVAAGRSAADVVRVVQYLPREALADLPRLDAYYRETFGARVPVLTTVVVHALLRAKALIEIECLAAMQGAALLDSVEAAGVDLAEARANALAVLAARGLTAADAIGALELVGPDVPAAPDPQGGWPAQRLQVVVPQLPGVGARVLLRVPRGRGAPVVCVAVESDPAAGDVAAQCRGLYAQLAERLTRAGASLASVVRTTEFVTPEGLTGYRHTADVRREAFAAPFPAATGVVCTRLARPGALLGLEAIAIRGAA